MTVYTKWHPRRPDWWLYKCDTCGEVFGNEAGLYTGVGIPQECLGCTCPTYCHLVGNPHPGAFHSDLQFHGDHYRA